MKLKPLNLIIYFFVLFDQVYRFLNENLSNRDGQDLFHSHPVIFVPNLNRFPGHSRVDPVAGRMLNRKEVWWADPTELFDKYHDSLLRYKSPLAKTKIVSSIHFGVYKSKDV